MTHIHSPGQSCCGQHTAGSDLRLWHGQRHSHKVGRIRQIRNWQSEVNAPTYLNNQVAPATHSPVSKLLELLSYSVLYWSFATPPKFVCRYHLNAIRPHLNRLAQPKKFLSQHGRTRQPGEVHSSYVWSVAATSGFRKELRPSSKICRYVKF